MIIKDKNHNNNYSLTQTCVNSTNGHNSRHDPRHLRINLTKPLRNFPSPVLNTIRKIEWIADKSKWWWHFTPKFCRWLRAMRSQRREAILLTLKAWVYKMDQWHFGVQLVPGVAIEHRHLYQLAGISRRRYYRALADLKAAGYVNSTINNQLTRNGEWRGFAGDKSISVKLLRALKLDKLAKRWEIQQQIDAREQKSIDSATQNRSDTSVMPAPKRPARAAVLDFRALVEHITGPP